MANKWTLKKQASEEVVIPNSTVGLYCNIYTSAFDNSINAGLAGTLIGGGQNSNYTYSNDNKYKYPGKETINADVLKEEVMNELKPYIEELGNKFDEIMKSKGFIKK